MNKLLITLCGFLVMGMIGATATTASAELCKDWSTQDTVLQAIGTSLIAVDWMQTRAAIADPHRRELNGLLGPHPTPLAINQYMLLSIGVHFGLSCWLPPTTRSIWQAYYIGYESRVVWHNHEVGVRIIGSF